MCYLCYLEALAIFIRAGFDTCMRVMMLVQPDQRRRRRDSGTALKTGCNGTGGCV